MITETKTRKLDANIIVYEISGRLNLGNSLLNIESGIKKLIDQGSRRLIDDLTSQMGDQQRTLEEAEALLSAERASARQLSIQVEDLTRERANLETQLQKERQSAAEGMQLLQLVQSKLGGAPQTAGNGNGSAAHLVEAV